ncbi:UNVERIFIED_CONTAM: hypothetical protein PYX00_010952 [Menopon gallinae]|uniref:PTS EIIB type-3 domain-containing protein n=1 Tax=Menopon gallinae TaxID=328185 RepID=A0AAW2H6M2_9NEOP
MKILLACSAGMSTSMLMDRVKKYMQDKNLEGDVVALSVTEAKEKLKDYDVVLVGPQVRFELGMKGDVVYELAEGLVSQAGK